MPHSNELRHTPCELSYITTQWATTYTNELHHTQNCISMLKRIYDLLIFWVNTLCLNLGIHSLHGKIVLQCSNGKIFVIEVKMCIQENLQHLFIVLKFSILQLLFTSSSFMSSDILLAPELNINAARQSAYTATKSFE